MRTIGQEAKHVGAWETNEGYVCFGSWQAVRAFYMHAQEALATPPAAPAATEAPSEPVKWGDPETVGMLIRQLQTIDPAERIYAAFHAEYQGKSRAFVRGVTLSRERVAGRLIDSQDKTVPYSHVIWSQPATPAPAVGASVQPAAGALPPVRWWSGVVGSPEKLANLLDGYSEKKESPRRDERVMRAAAKWIREVGASVQPVLASLSDEQRVHLDQAADMLDSYGCDQRKRGNDSTGEGAAASAYVLRQMLATTSSAASEVKPPVEHQGMTIAGNGAEMLGALMREQRASMLGVYPDGNPNAFDNRSTKDQP